MKGVREYDCSKFHPVCPGVTIVDVGGFPNLWCPVCRCLCNLEAVSPKFPSYELGPKEPQPVEVLP